MSISSRSGHRLIYHRVDPLNAFIVHRFYFQISRFSKYENKHIRTSSFWIRSYFWIQFSHRCHFMADKYHNTSISRRVFVFYFDCIIHNINWKQLYYSFFNYSHPASLNNTKADVPTGFIRNSNQKTHTNRFRKQNTTSQYRNTNPRHFHVNGAFQNKTHKKKTISQNNEIVNIKARYETRIRWRFPTCKHFDRSKITKRSLTTDRNFRTHPSQNVIEFVEKHTNDKYL